MHGWIHERNMTLDAADERELAFRAIDTLEKVSGTRPAGIRTPSWDFSAATMGITRELGLLYDSSLMADDEPYEVIEDGVPTGIVEIPVEWIRDDAVYFSMDRYTGLRPYASTDAVLRIWVDEFEGAWADGGLFQLTMHPHVSGHRSRMRILDDLITHISGRGNAWFATHAEIAEYVKTRG
jgi:peptidoglycan/xylan/chitin deacetylase (PgdA/CDA1 family)